MKLLVLVSFLLSHCAWASGLENIGEVITYKGKEYKKHYDVKAQISVKWRRGGHDFPVYEGLYKDRHGRHISFFEIAPGKRVTLESKKVSLIDLGAKRFEVIWTQKRKRISLGVLDVAKFEADTQVPYYPALEQDNESSISLLARFTSDKCKKHVNRIIGSISYYRATEYLIEFKSSSVGTQYLNVDKYGFTAVYETKNECESEEFPIPG